MKKSTAIIICLVAVIIVACVAFFQESGKSDNPKPQEVEPLESDTDVKDNGEQLIDTKKLLSTEDEDFKVISFWDEEISTHLMEKMPEYIPPQGYKEPILSEETALTILCQAWKMRNYLIFSGCSENSIDIWGDNPHNKIDMSYEHQNEYMVYFVPALDTMEKFDSYFSEIFVEETLEQAKQYYSIREKDGKLVGFNSVDKMGYIICDYWDKAELVSVEQEENSNKAVVTLNTYHKPDGTFYTEQYPMGTREYTMIYSEEYGWRVYFEYILQH